MSLQKHVILRKGETSTRGATRGRASSGPATVAPARPVAVEVGRAQPGESARGREDERCRGHRARHADETDRAGGAESPGSASGRNRHLGRAGGRRRHLAVYRQRHCRRGARHRHRSESSGVRGRRSWCGRTSPTQADDDDHGHGTHCAGTIFGRDVNNTRIGIARGVKKAMIGKVLGAERRLAATW